MTLSSSAVAVLLLKHREQRFCQAAQPCQPGTAAVLESASAGQLTPPGAGSADPRRLPAGPASPPGMAQTTFYQGVHKPSHAIMLILQHPQVQLQVLRLHKRNWFLSTDVKLLEPRHVLAKLQLAPGHAQAK
ncbi:MAG: hypothetical protein FRX49_10140 [Trebouxia sp. A1-2]|nr:MAG: hypothetical protein FRX49_10140 [Trebouxia sp. A1-2]